MMREGPFWDVMAGRVVPPPAAVTLGWQLIAVDPDAGTIEVAFRAAEQFLNPVDVVQGGFLAAMLEPVFAQHKAVRGFDRFVCRGQRMCATLPPLTCGRSWSNDPPTVFVRATGARTVRPTPQQRGRPPKSG